MGNFWSFSLEIYRDARVRSALLHLQDSRGADVNLLLFALWSQAPLDEDRVRALEHEVKAWRRAAIEPLRAVRRALGGAVGAAPPDEVARLRSAVLELEIDAERIEQAILENAMPGTRSPGGGVPAAANLAAVIGLDRRPFDEADREALAVLAGAAGAVRTSPSTIA